MNYKARFDAADLAWVAAGASEDGQHSVPSAEFFGAFFALRNSLPADEVGWTQRKAFSERIQALIFDLVCANDAAHSPFG
jgi:hypothetical protein